MPEEIKKEEIEETTPSPDEATEETEETTEEVETEESKEESTDIDHKKELETLQQKPRSELEKAQRALHFNAERLKELGGDPTEVLGLKPKPETDTQTLIEKTLDKRELRALCDSEDEFQHAEWYMDNKGLTAEEAYLLANKGKVQRATLEAKRAQVTYSKGTPVSEKPPVQKVPEMPIEAQQVLQRRGLQFNPKTKTWQGKYTETYWNPATNSWESRKLKR